MALQTSSVNINIRGGLDRKTDGRLVIPSKLVVANDVEFADHETVVTRCGTSRVDVAAGFADPVRMFEHSGVPTIEFKNGATVRANGSTTASQYGGVAPAVGDSNKLMRVGALTRRLQQLNRKPVGLGIGVSLYTLNFDTAYGVSAYCLVWENDRTGTVQWSVRNIATDQELTGGLISSGTDRFVKPRVIYDSTNARFAIFYARYAAGGLRFDVYGAYTPESGGALTTVGVLIATVNGVAVESTVSTAALFDVAIYPAQGYSVVARSTVVAGNVYMRLVDLALVALVATTNSAPAAVPVSLTAHATFAAAVLTGHAIYGVGLNLRGYRLPSDTGVQSVEVTIVTYGTTLVGRIVVTNFSGDLLITHDGFTSTANSYGLVNVLRCTTAHVLVSQVNATRVYGFLAGRMFTMRSREYVPVVFTSAQYQSVILVVDLTEAATGLGTLGFPLSVVARLDWGEVANPSPLALDAAHRVPGCSEHLMPYLKYESNTRLAGVTDVTAVTVAAAKFVATEQLGDVEWNGLTYLAGALPMVTDGRQLVEEGFHWNPEVVGTVTNGLVVIPPVLTGTGIYDFPGIGTYTVAFTESWQDAHGNWHESGTAFLCSVTTVALNLGINPVILRAPTLKTNVRLTMYRTLMSSTNTTLYLAHTDELGLGGYVVEANLASGEPLYTEGGVLGNTPMPSCRQISTFQKRLVASGCGDGSKIYFSKENAQGFAAEFVSDDVSHQQIIPPKAGRVVATVEMSGKLVVAGEQEIGIVYGNGPNAQGTQGEYSAFETVAENVGAMWAAPKSVKLSAEGVWFQSSYGLRLFGGQGVVRNQEGRPVGSEVDDLVGGTVVTLAGGTLQQTRFFTSYDVFVWDQVWGQFTRFTNHLNLDSCFVAGDYYFVAEGAGGASALLRRRDPEWIASDSTINGGVPSLVPVIGDITLGDIQFGGVQGFQRVRNMLLLAKINDLAATPQFAIHVGYDNADVAGAPEVTAIPAVGAKLVVQFEHQFFTQKCESLRLQIKFYDPAGFSTVRLTDLALSVGVKKGPWKSSESK